MRALFVTWESLLNGNGVNTFDVTSAGSVLVSDMQGERLS